MYVRCVKTTVLYTIHKESVSMLVFIEEFFVVLCLLLSHLHCVPD